MKNPPQREPKKPKSAPDKGKRYRCCVCKKRALRKTTEVPYFCSANCRAVYERDGESEWNAPSESLQ